MDEFDVDEALCNMDEENDDGIQELLGGLNLKTVYTTGTEFKVEVNEESALDMQRAFDGQTIFEHINMDSECFGDVDPYDSDVKNADKMPFEILALKMTNLTPDGKVKKRILSEGYGEVVPPNSLVWFHHNNYVELNEIPFDSSYMRGHPTMIRLNCSKCIIGLDIALSTMKCEEKAEVLIHPDYAFGKMGVPPRIPPDSHILIRVEMKKFVDNSLAKKMGEYTDEELKTLSFDEIYQGALALLQEGKHAFSQKKYPHAERLYRKAIRSLENCDMKSDADDAKNEALRLKLYTNLGVTLNKMGTNKHHKQAIVACQKAITLKRNHVKGLYNLGLAHLQLGGTDEAKKYAMLARKYAPLDTSISALLQRIDYAMNRYKTSSVTFAKNAFKSFCDKDIELKKSNSADGKNKSDFICVEQSVQDEISQNTYESSRGVKIVELDENKNNVQDIKSTTKSEEASEKNTKTSDPSNYIGSDFEKEAVKYIKGFFEDPTERDLVVPFCLSYEEELFFKKQTTMYGLHWEEKQDYSTGRSIIHIKK